MEVAIRKGFVILQNTSIPTDSGRLKEVMSLECVTFHLYGGLEKRPLLEVYYDDFQFFRIMVV